MAETTFSPPEKLNFNVGFVDKVAGKEPVVKLTKKVKVKKIKKQRIPIKKSFWKSVGQSAKAASRKSSLLRSSVLRQGKFAEARSNGGDVKSTEARK